MRYDEPNRKQIEARAKELGHTVRDSYGKLECYDAAGKLAATFERQPRRLHFMGDTREDVLSAFPGCTVISCD